MQVVYNNVYIAIYDNGLVEVSGPSFGELRSYLASPGMFDAPSYPLWRTVHRIPPRVIREARKVLKANLALCN